VTFTQIGTRGIFTFLIYEKAKQNFAKKASREPESLSGPAEIRNPDDASGARIEVFRFAQYLNDDKRILSILLKSASEK